MWDSETATPVFSWADSIGRYLPIQRRSLHLEFPLDIGFEG